MARRLYHQRLSRVRRWVTQTPDRLRVVDVWETQEEFDKFAQEQIGPYTQEVGMQAPQMKVHEVHNHFITS